MPSLHELGPTLFAQNNLSSRSGAGCRPRLKACQYGQITHGGHGSLAPAHVHHAAVHLHHDYVHQHYYALWAIKRMR